MMAFDRTPSQPRLEPDTVAALSTALSASVPRGDLPPDLHDLLCRAAEEARTKDIAAEQLLLILKDIWHSLPEVTGAASRDVESTLLQQLISRCIQAYYSL
ncbi:MAG TPA: hypothetical protein VN600_14710 [Gemmatimonadaceae bacterium]|jgi:hypothetical protein|nr:hypothetical protein [Gemmatimonadaceae bacterium]